MRKIINIILAISIVVIILGIIIVIFPTFFNKINQYLSNLSNFITYLGMLFAAFALLIAILAYKSASMRPNLKLDIFTHMSEANGPALLLNRKTKIVSDCRPLTEWYLILENTGEVSAKYPVVQIDFKGAYFTEEDFPGWKAIRHAHALGWFGFQWSPEENMIIHPNLPIQLPTMYFNNKYIDEIPLEINITIVADGFKKKTYNIPVKIEFEEFDE
ncbi:unnamed protein product [marine sediment metagenome]|uniref:Uncharacterized protein n=1 Tax=marine sediment metagenome TaxID=412755 RepID=X1BNZ7_9ZZZZ